MTRELHKLIVNLIAVSVMALAFEICVLADDSIIVGMDQYKTQDDKIIVYVNHNQGEDFRLDMGDSTVVVGKQNLAMEGVTKFKDTGESMSYMFIVDISGSMDKERIEAAKEIISLFIAQKKDGDNCCVVTMGDEITESGFLEDTEALYAFIDTIEVTRQDTDLYKSIKEQLNVLQTDKSVHDKRCLVILSDGADDQADGITKEEAETQVKDAHIPIFTIALLPGNYKDSDLESAKILGSFARYSAGGEHYAPLLDGLENKDVYERIENIIENSLVITADLAEIVADDGNIYLGVQLSDGMVSGKDGMQIPAGDILDAVEQAQSVQVNVNINKNNTMPEVTEASEEVQEMITTDVEEIQENSMSGFVVILAIVVVIVLSVAAVIVLVLRRSKKDEAIVEENLCSTGDGRTEGISREVESVPTGSGVRITLFRVGPGVEESYALVINGRKSIGRKSHCDLCFEGDTALSGVHCFLFCVNNRIYVQDNNSTNGTFINGVPITGEYCVEDGDVMLIGSAEYRIVCE